MMNLENTGKKYKYELRFLLNKYIFNSSAGIVPMKSSFSDLKKLVPFIQQFVDFDNPDGYSKIDNTILIMEHFQFDATKNSVKKGSTSQREYARIDRENKKKDVMHCEINYENYKNNLLKTFDEHYKKIENYKKNLIKELNLKCNSVFKVAFFIEDTTPLGCVDIDTRKIVYPIFCRELITSYEKADNLDYIFSFNEVGSEKHVLFTNKSSISELKSNSLCSENTNLIPWVPQILAFNCRID